MNAKNKYTFHRYTERAKSMKSIYTAFWYKLVLFLHSGLNEVWCFGMLTLWYEVASTWRLVRFLTNDISDMYLTPLSANHLFDQRSYGIRRYGCCVPIKILKCFFLGQFSATPKWGIMSLRLRQTPDRGLKIRICLAKIWTNGHSTLMRCWQNTVGTVRGVLLRERDSGINIDLFHVWTYLRLYMCGKHI